MPKSLSVPPFDWASILCPQSASCPVPIVLGRRYLAVPDCPDALVSSISSMFYKGHPHSTRVRPQQDHEGILTKDNILDARGSREVDHHLTPCPRRKLVTPAPASSPRTVDQFPDVLPRRRQIESRIRATVRGLTPTSDSTESYPRESSTTGGLAAPLDPGVVPRRQVSWFANPLSSTMPAMDPSLL